MHHIYKTSHLRCGTAFAGLIAASACLAQDVVEYASTEPAVETLAESVDASVPAVAPYVEVDEEAPAAVADDAVSGMVIDREAEKEAYERSERLRLEKKTDEEVRLKTISSKTFRLDYADATDVASRLNAAWSGDFGDGWKVLRVAQAFPEANAVMVTAPNALIEACEDVIKTIDVEPQQVYIEARFVELANNASHKLGIDWQMLDGMKGSLALDAGLNERKMKGVSSYISPDGTYSLTGNENGSSKANLSYINATLGMSELYVTLRALESTEDARVFSNPKIIVASGKKATVDMTTKYPNVRIAAKRTTNSGGDSLDLDMQMAAIPGEDKMMFANEAFFSWGISLDVTPRVSTNGMISVQIVPTISSQSDWVTAGATASTADSTTISAKYPVIDVQRLVTDFDMESGTTAVIGGLSRTVETQMDNGIPLLRNLWWIGPRLFGSKVRIKEQREIIVFVTVGLVNPSEIRKDAGLPKNAILGRQYTDGVRREPGDRRYRRVEGITTLDLRPLEEQYADPRRTNTVNRSMWIFKDEYNNKN